MKWTIIGLLCGILAIILSVNILNSKIYPSWFILLIPIIELSLGLIIGQGIDMEIRRGRNPVTEPYPEPTEYGTG